MSVSMRHFVIWYSIYIYIYIMVSDYLYFLKYIEYFFVLHNSLIVFLSLLPHSYVQ